MTIPEASQLVLQAGAMGNGGEIFILDMGEPVKVVDLARDLIRLSGLVPNEDIEIRFTGIRPGEKLFEELATDEEHAESTMHRKIFVGKFRQCPWATIERAFTELHTLSEGNDAGRIEAAFARLVPEFRAPPQKQPASDVASEGKPDATPASRAVPGAGHGALDPSLS